MRSEDIYKPNVFIAIRVFYYYTMIQNVQKQLLNLINNHALDEFLQIYQQCLYSLRSFERIEILLRACRFGTVEFVENIFNKDSLTNMNCRHPSTGYTPLFIAIRAKQYNIVKYLIEKTEVDTTCLQEALRQRDMSIVKLLLQHGAIVDEQHLRIAIGECFREDCKVCIRKERLYRILIFLGDKSIIIIRNTSYLSI